MKTKYIIAANCAIIYGVIIIIINCINVNYALQNTIPEYNPNNGTGCIIQGISRVKNFSIPIIVCACCMVLLMMCLLQPDTQKCMENDASCGGMPPTLTFIMYLIIFILSLILFRYGEDESNFGSNWHKSIDKFITTGCDPKLVRVIYATIFINTLPGLIAIAGIGCFIVGSILYGIGILIWKWLSTSCVCCKCEWKSSLSQATPNISERPTHRQNNNLDVRIAMNTINHQVANPPQNNSRKHLQRAESITSLPPAYEAVFPQKTYGEVDV